MYNNKLSIAMAALLLPLLLFSIAQASEYIVREGDTLFSICTKEGVSQDDVCRINGISDPSTIRAGSRLQLHAKAISERKVVNALALNVREGAGLDKDLKGVLRKGQHVAILDTEGEWSLISADNGIKGWVYSSYLVEKRSTTPSRSGRTGDEIISIAERCLGIPYVWGGSSLSGYDCSGFVQAVFAGLGIKLPRVSFEQFKKGKPLEYSDLLPGDVVFFSTYAPGASHAAIYIGNDSFIHASSSAGRVTITRFTSYYKSRYMGARRFN